MSRIEARVTAYDYMDRIQLIVRIRETETTPGASDEWETLVAEDIQGEGVTDRRAWLQDALIAIMESL